MSIILFFSQHSLVGWFGSGLRFLPLRGQQLFQPEHGVPTDAGQDIF
jgi:hypothetical protein